MEKVNSDESIRAAIAKKMSVIYFTGRDCGACDVIKTKIESILKSYPNIKAIEVDGENNISLCAKYGAFSLPLFILYTEGKETIRVGRNINLLELENIINRYYNMIFL